MKIVFWSCYSGKAAVTSNAIAVSSLVALRYRANTCIFPTQFINGNLKRAFVSNRDFNSLKVFSDAGADAVLRNVKCGTVDGGNLANSAYSFLGQRLHVYLPTKSTNRQAFEAEMNSAVSRVASALDSAFEVAVIDSVAGVNVCTANVLKEADLVVVCLPQSYEEIEAVFRDCNFSANKYFFLFGNYDANAICSVKNVIKHYRKFITTKNSGFIPHCTGFNDAMNTSSATKFFLQNIKCGKGDSNYPFIQAASEVAEKLMLLGNVKIRKGETF